MDFFDELQRHPLDGIRQRIAAATDADVRRALTAERLGLDDFAALLSPAAEPQLEAMARRAHQRTLQRFGRTILLYAPLYLSNECSNGCVYCGFSADNKIPRATLDLDTIEREARVLHDQGFRHILLVTGESPLRAGVDYVAAAAERLRPLFSSIAVEIFPCDTDGYRRLVESGVDGLTLYQETYDPALYDRMHRFGRKKDYRWRLGAPERGGDAGLRRIGIGSLLGLGEPRSEAFRTGLHALYLSKRYWRSHLSISFPRMRPADGGFQPLNPVSDRLFVQLICALRLLLPDCGLVLSTRESATLRDHLLPLGITQMSAGSCTAPGGYSGDGGEELHQFAIDDDRTPAEVAAMLRQRGYDPVWKDWDAAFLDRHAG